MANPSSTSSISAARAALYALLVAGAPDATSQITGQPARKVQIAFGPPAHEEMEVVALLGVRNVDEDAASLGAHRREETFELEVGIKAQNPAAGPHTAEAVANGKPSALTVDARGFFLADWVRSVVQQHWTLSDTVRYAAVTDQITDGVQLVDKGGLIFLLLTVTCEADILAAAAP